ncbi:hypothetical protein LTR62_007675 [Meristemomyces frigidus]|uniref:Ribonuclease H2 subunit B n=1 Tax=Meristemomyces frigidus TaxID=1508187 RepID=A0AAN7TBS5_9PEZI|nr:hypothetical protein LTR62_007675 [Meristemomyces frigidus]
MKIRAKKTPVAKAQSLSQEITSESTKHTLPPTDQTPPKAFILPSTNNDDGPDISCRFITLPHPATGNPHRYYVDAEKRCYELTKVGPPKKACRSMLLTPETQAHGSSMNEVDGQNGYILQTPDLIIATPIDPLFLLIPALWSADSGKETAGEWATFYDRLFEDDGRGYGHLRSIFLNSDSGKELERTMEISMHAICDNIEMGERSYKLNLDKLATMILRKVQRMVKNGLPASMEEHFVKKPLERPEMSLRREDSSISMIEAETVEGVKQGSIHVDNAKTGVADDQVKHLLRLRTCVTYLATSYLPPTLATRLHPLISDFIDFTPLDIHLVSIAKLKAEASALRFISDNISRKRAGGFDEAALDKAETKKRKKEEDERNKKNVSQGVKRLGKVDTSGMKKMNSFFTKPAAGMKGKG